MLNHKPNAHGGFTPDAITPEQVLRHHRSAQRGYGGDRHCPLLHCTCILDFISKERNFPEPKK